MDYTVTEQTSIIIKSPQQVGPDGLERAVWPGGYPLAYRDAEGELHCPECAAAAVRDESAELPLFGNILWEGPAEHCTSCGCELETAYGDPDADGAEAAD